MSLLREFREAVQAELQEDLELEFLPGFTDGPGHNRSFGCCWAVSVEENEAVVLEDLLVYARVFLRWEQQADPEIPIDSGPFEDMAEAIQVAILDARTTLGPYQARVTGVEIDMTAQMVQARILGIAANVGYPAA